MKSLHLLITGRVQGVGFRDWLIREAKRLSLSGWVRNIGADTVEAIIAGPDEAIDLCLQRCWRGPALAEVTDIHIEEAPPPAEPGFARRSTIPPDR
jgi:acylphosphatase